MQAVISLLPEPYNAQVERIWNHLEDRFGLKYIRITPIPHFTWQLGEGYQEENVLSFLNELALRLEPFEVRTNGLNHFAGISPILFIEVRKSVKLTKLHTHPHITLAMEDLGWEMLDEVTAMLQKTKMKWRFKLDNFAIACQHADGKAQVEHIFRFGKGLTESFDCGLPPL